MRLLWDIITMPLWVLYWCIQALLYLLRETVAILIAAPKAVANFRKWEQEHYWYIFPKKKPPTHGDADFASLQSLKKTVHTKPDGWLMGILDGQRIFNHPEACAIGVAPRRAGKSIHAQAQIRALAERQQKPDITVVDPHGDLRMGTQEYLEGLGYRVITMDFTQPEKSPAHNPLSVLRRESLSHLTNDILQFVKQLAAEDRKGSNDHFLEMARSIIKGFVSHKARTDASAKLHDIVGLMLASKSDREEALTDMAKPEATMQERLAANAYASVGTKERGSIISTLTRKLEVWTKPNFITMTSQDGWTWEQIFFDLQPTAVFITAGAGADEGAASRLLLGNCINTRAYLWDTLRDKHTGAGRPRFPKELRILVDEARLMGNCPAIVDAVTALGKADVTVMMWFLSLRDMFDVYPEASVIANSSNMVLFGGGMEKSTYEEVSWAIGEYTIENQSISENDGGQSRGRNEQSRRRSKPDELRRLEDDELVAVMGRLSVKLKKPAKKVDGTIVFL